MPRNKLSFKNWVIDGHEERFSTYMDAFKAKQAHPDIYSRTADIKHVPPTS